MEFQSQAFESHLDALEELFVDEGDDLDGAPTDPVELVCEMTDVFLSGHANERGQLIEVLQSLYCSLHKNFEFVIGPLTLHFSS